MNLRCNRRIKSCLRMSIHFSHKGRLNQESFNNTTGYYYTESRMDGKVFMDPLLQSMRVCTVIGYDQFYPGSAWLAALIHFVCNFADDLLFE